MNGRIAGVNLLISFVEMRIIEPVPTGILKLVRREITLQESEIVFEEIRKPCHIAIRGKRSNSKLQRIGYSICFIRCVTDPRSVLFARIG